MSCRIGSPLLCRESHSKSAKDGTKSFYQGNCRFVGRSSYTQWGRHCPRSSSVGSLQSKRIKAAQTVSTTTVVQHLPVGLFTANGGTSFSHHLCYHVVNQFHKRSGWTNLQARWSPLAQNRHLRKGIVVRHLATPSVRRPARFQPSRMFCAYLDQRDRPLPHSPF